jgi:hypothetical protein
MPGAHTGKRTGKHYRRLLRPIIAIGNYERFDVVDLYNKSGMTLKNLVKYKRLKDRKTGTYKNFPYPDYVDIPFNPETDEYPYPFEAN